MYKNVTYMTVIAQSRVEDIQLYWSTGAEILQSIEYKLVYFWTTWF